MEQNQIQEELIVTRDGQLDDEYYDQVWAMKRQAALRAAGRELLEQAMQAPVVIGRGLVWLMTHEHAGL